VAGGEPEAADDDRRAGTAGEENTVGTGGAARGALRQGTDAAGVERHRRHGADAESQDVRASAQVCRQRERGQHPQEVRAAGQPVQDADAERRVRVRVCRRCPRRRRRRDRMRMAMQVQVGVARAVVFVLVHVGATPNRLLQSPQTDRDQDDADETLAPGRNAIERQHAAQQQRRDRDEPNSAGVAGAPQQAGEPAAAAPRCSQRGDGRQVIGARQDVHEASREASNEMDQDRAFPNGPSEMGERFRGGYPKPRGSGAGLGVGWRAGRRRVMNGDWTPGEGEITFLRPRERGTRGMDLLSSERSWSLEPACNF